MEFLKWGGVSHSKWGMQLPPINTTVACFFPINSSKTFCIESHTFDTCVFFARCVISRRLFLFLFLFLFLLFSFFF